MERLKKKGYKKIVYKKEKNKAKKKTKINNKVSNIYIIYFIFLSKLILIFLFIFYYYLQIHNINNDKYNIMKVCLCTYGKEENKYIEEFIVHYKNYGVDKIYLYDNNNIDGEKFEDVINKYIKSGFVEIINYRGITRSLYKMMDECYRNNYMKYDWLIFYDIDEYIHLKNISNIKDYLNSTNFNKCDSIHLNWLHHTDNNLFHYEKKPLKERFPKTENKLKCKDIKSILKGGISNLTIYCIHNLNLNLKFCNGFGKPIEYTGICLKDYDIEYYYIDHYSSKSTGEFIDKMNKGDVIYMKDNVMERINAYFKYNEITKEKIDYFSKGIQGFNSSNLKNELMNKLKEKNSYI